MILYGITLIPLSEKIRAADLGLLSPSYADDTSFDNSERRSAQILKLLMKRGAHRGCFTDPSKSLFVLDTPGQEEASKSEFMTEGLELNFVSGSRYMGAYLVPQEELVVWVKPQVEAWAHRFRIIGKIA